MILIASFSVLGFTPIPWTVPNFGSGVSKAGKPFSFSRRGRKSRPAEFSPDLERWQKLIRDAATEAMAGREPCESPVILAVSFRERTPPGKCHGEVWFPGVKLNEDGVWVKAGLHEPDLTNLTKAIEDPLEGVVYRNDIQVRGHASECLYWHTPGIEVAVSEYTPDDFRGLGDPVPFPEPEKKARKPRKKG